MLNKMIKNQMMKIMQLAVVTLCLSTMIWMLPNNVVSEPPASGDWIVTGNETYSNQTIIMNGNLLILNNGSLSLNNVTLKMNSTDDGQYIIQVCKGGKFFIQNSVVMAYNSSHRYRFEVFGTLNARNANITDLGYVTIIYIDLIPSMEFVDGGLKVFSGNLTLMNSTISESKLYGIYAENANVRIVNSTIRDNNDTGVYLTSCNTTLLNNTITGNGGYGIYAKYQRLILENNYITDNKKENIFQQWCMTVKIIDKENRPVEGAVVTIEDNFHNVVINSPTDIQGYTATKRRIDITEYKVGSNGIETLFTPHRITAEKGNISISVNITVNENKDLVLTLDLLPDLEITSLKFYPKNPTEGEKVVINITICNFGYHEAYNVSVIVLDNDIEIYNVTINLSMKGEENWNKTISIIWDATSGEHRFEAIVDRNNQIPEIREDNNNISETLFVLAKVESPQSTDIWIIICGVPVVIVACAIIAKRLRRR